jgi:hypothetical protein
MENIKMKKDNEVAEFEIGDLLPIGMTLVVLTIGLAYGLQVLGDVKSDMTENSVESNATGEGIEGLAKIPNKLPMIVTVIIAAVVIGILVRYLWKQFA